MDFLEECKVRFVEVQKRVAVLQAEMQAAQARFQAAQQEAQSLHFMVATETSRRQQQQQPTITVLAQTHVTSPPPQPIQDASPAQPADVNKTDLVRDFLRQRPGATPTEIWKEVKSQMNHRAYLYSILGRLKERGEVVVRRGKYCLRAAVPKPAEEKEQAPVLH